MHLQLLTIVLVATFGYSSALTKGICDGPIVDLAEDAAYIEETNYAPRTRCNYKFRIPANQEVLVNVEELDLPATLRSGRCRGDYLKFYSRPKVQLCGGMPDDPTFVLPARRKSYDMKVAFRTDRYDQGLGFKINLQLLTTPQEPEMPETPGTPENPETPSEPEMPETPGTPETPETPLEPEMPETPGTPETPETPSEPAQCGVKGDDGVPWQVLLTCGYNEKFCGGTLISDSLVLTSASCLQELRQYPPVGVYVGQYDIENRSPSVRNKIALTITPNQFNPNISFALVFLSHDFQLGSKRNPICLPCGNYNSDLMGAQATVSGVGSGTVVNEEQVAVISNEECVQSHGDNIDSHMLCTKNVVGNGINSCRSDRGGPLVVMQDHEGTETSVLAGAISSNVGCGDEAKPAVYARLTDEVMNWLTSFNLGDGTNLCGNPV